MESNQNRFDRLFLCKIFPCDLNEQLSYLGINRGRGQVPGESFGITFVLRKPNSESPRHKLQEAGAGHIV